jgi:hypothetical protein
MKVRTQQGSGLGGRDIIIPDKELDRLCGLVVRVPGYRTEMHSASYEVRTEFI